MTATRAALEAIERLSGAHGPLAVFVSGGCCDGSSPICLAADELPPSPHDLRLGTVGGAPVYIDAEQYERRRRPDFVLDVSPGPPEGFSLGLPDQHLVTRTVDGSACTESG